MVKILAANPHANIVQPSGGLLDQSFRGDSDVGRTLLTGDKLKDCRGLVGIPMEMADVSLRYWLRRRGQDLGAKQCTADRFDFDMVPRCVADM